MSPEVANLVQVVLLDAIKILGPAAIAAYAAYKAASIQLEVKLKELDKTHQYQARQNIFLQLKERLAHIDQETDKLNSELGRLLGYATGLQDSGSAAASDEYATLLLGAIEPYKKLLPLEVASLVSDMHRFGLGATEELKTLSTHSLPNFDAEATTTYTTLKAHLLELIEVFNLMGICTRLLVQKQMEQVLSPFIEPRGNDGDK